MKNMSSVSAARLLLEKGLAREALEVAKKAHKRNPSAESQSDLIAVYFCRIDQLTKKGETTGAQTLLENLREKFPSTRSECEFRLLHLKNGGLSAFDLALFGYISAKIESPEQREYLERLIPEIVDPEQISSSKVIPPDHPLKAEARVIADAFKAVTQGKGLKKFQESLKMVGRNSPLAHWRRAIHALDCFYRRDDEGMKHHLSGIPPHLSVAALALAFPHFSDSKAIAEASPDIRILFDEVCRDGLGFEVSRMLTGKLDFSKKAGLDAAERILRSVQEQVPIALNDVCREILSQAALSKKGKNFALTSALLRKLKVEECLLLVWEAKAFTQIDPYVSAKCLIGSVLKSEDSLFSAAEKAWLLRKAAHYITSADEEEIEVQGWVKSLKKKALPKKVKTGEGPLPEKSKRAISRGAIVYVTTIEILERSLEYFYFPETFRMLIGELSELGRPRKEIDAALLRWHELDPQNVEPLLQLIQRTHQTAPVEKTLSLLDTAQTIDPLNRQLPALRLATLFDGWEKALRAEKVTAAEKYCENLDKVLSPGNPARQYWRCLQWAMSLRVNAAKPMESCPFGPEVPEDVKKIVLYNLRELAGISLPQSFSLALTGDVEGFLKALGQICLGWVAVDRILELSLLDIQKIRQATVKMDLGSGELLALCKCAEREFNAQMIFLLTEIGLRKKDHETCKYLYFRAFSWIFQNKVRASQIFLAAKTLAIQVGDKDIVELAQEMVDALGAQASSRLFSSLFGLEMPSPPQRQNSLSPEEVQKLVNEETGMTIEKCKPQNRAQEPSFRTGRRPSRKKKDPFFDPQGTFDW